MTDGVVVGDDGEGEGAGEGGGGVKEVALRSQGEIECWKCWICVC